MHSAGFIALPLSKIEGIYNPTLPINKTVLRLHPDNQCDHLLWFLHAGLQTSSSIGLENAER
ncbi:MAG: hypothetical protein ACI8ZM_000065 [Crocinitomix sp.]|jgi:hypothetical protein